MNNLHSILSLNLATWLKMNGHKIVKVEKINNRAAFFFEKSEELRRSIDDYNSNEELKRFISTYRDIRGITKGIK